MMGEYVFGDRGQIHVAKRDAVADFRMGAHLQPLVIGQRAGFLQDAVFDADLADVVHHAQQRDLFKLFGRYVQRLPNLPAVILQPLDVFLCLLAFGGQG